MRTRRFVTLGVGLLVGFWSLMLVATPYVAAHDYPQGVVVVAAAGHRVGKRTTRVPRRVSAAGGVVWSELFNRFPSKGAAGCSCPDPGDR